MEREEIIKELKFFKEYDINYINTLDNFQLNSLFNTHCEKYSEEIEAGELVNNYTDTNFLMSTPDGYLEIGDFWIKDNKQIYNVKTADGFSAKVSHDHLFETQRGWVHTHALTKKDSILTKDGYRRINYIYTTDKKEETYDWEVLHENHRYWAGNGLSSHNTGKTYLILNSVKRAIDMGYNVIFYDSEAAVDRELMKKFGIDTTKVNYQPVNTVQDFRTSVTTITSRMQEAKRAGAEIPKMMIILDSAGNLATAKEIEDAKSGSEKSDMTRSKVLKSIFRIIMTPMADLKIPFLFTNHTYQTQSFISQQVAGGGCLVPGSKVVMNDGSLKNIEDIVEGDQVLTLMGSKEIENIWTFEKKTYKIEFEDGSTIECSENHRFFIGNETDDPLDNKNWVFAKDLVKNNKVSRYNNTQLKVKSVTELKSTKVHDLTVEDAQHYISENGVINHNTGPEYAASIVLFLNKAQLKEGGEKAGIIVTAKPNKNRFAKPNPIKFHLHFSEGMNSYVGLENYIDWEDIGIARGSIEKGQKVPKATARGWICKHIDDVVSNNEFFTDKVFTQEILEKIDKKIYDLFNYNTDVKFSVDDIMESTIEDED